MRLIKTDNLELIEVWAEFTPAYAILSHRWGDEEISLAEYQCPTPGTKDKGGWQKITACAKQALLDGYAYLWVDTCCIDKTSSADLSEAINSMYRLYQQAALCYVHLNDVPHESAFDADSEAGMTVPFERSQWFTRGWTLQELLAPTNIHFYSQEWLRLDANPDIEIHQHISRATGIGIDILKGDTPIYSTSIARRMSWASRRRTTRTEDIAYCLLGIFDVNMPMLYGEGPKAFIRLQEEIMKTSRDQTLFVWTHVNDDPTYTGVLARHPQNFGDSADFEDKSQLQEFNGYDYQAGREGVTLSMFMGWDDLPDEIVKSSSQSEEHKSEAKPQLCTARLKCAENDRADRFAGIHLVNVESHFMRYKQTKLQLSRPIGMEQDVFIRHQVPQQPARKLKQEYIRVLFETNCPNAFVFAMPSKSKAPSPLFRSKKARAAAEPALAHNAELAAEIAERFDGRRLNYLDEGEIPLRHLTMNKREVFSPMDYELGYNVPISDLKWILPILPRSIIAYMRIVPGINTRDYRGEPQGVSIGIDANARLGFNSGHKSAGDGSVSDNIVTTPISYRRNYSLFFHHKRYDRPTAGDEVAEVKVSLRHHEELETKLKKTDSWEYKAGQDKCPCETTS